MQRKRTSWLAATALAVAGLGLTTDNALAAPIIEDFSSYPLGTDLSGGTGGWYADTPVNTEGEVSADPVNSGNKVGFFRRTGNPATGGRYLDLGANMIADGASGEFSVQFLFDGLPNSVFGLSSLTNPDVSASGGAGTQLSVLFRVNRGDLQYMVDQSHSIFQTLASNLLSNTWYELSVDVNNTTNTISNIYFEGSLVASGPYQFNQPATDGDLVTFAVYEQGFTQGIYLDDIAVGSSTVPEPASVLLLATGIGLILMKRPRRRGLRIPRSWRAGAR